MLPQVLKEPALIEFAWYGADWTNDQTDRREDLEARNKTPKWGPIPAKLGAKRAEDVGETYFIRLSWAPRQLASFAPPLGGADEMKALISPLQTSGNKYPLYISFL